MITQTLKNWHTNKIGKLGTVVTGKTPPTAHKEFYGGDYPFITPSDIGTFDMRYLSETERTISERWISSNKKYVLPRNAITYVCIGSTVGKIGITKRESITNQQINSLIANPDKLIPQYGYYLLRNITPEIQQIASARGVGKGIINKTQFEDFDVSLPNIENQKQIAAVLSTYDDLIENNTRRIQILEQMAQAVYTEWFGSPESNWEIVPLRDVLKSYIGGGWGKEEPDKKYSGPAYVIRGTDMPNASTGNISTCPFRYHTPSNLRARVLQAGDLVFEVSGGSKGQPVGRSLLITNNLLGQFKQSAICASFCKLIRPNQDKISPFQLYEQILNWYTNGIIEKYQVQSTGISNFRFESFIDEEKVALPPQEVRDKFDDIVSPLFDEIYSLGNQNQNLRQMRDLLLSKLVTGEIEVK